MTTVHWAFLLLWRVPQSLPLKNSPTAWGCYQHTLLLDWYSAGDEQCLFPSNMTLRIEVHQTRKSCFSESEGPFGAFLQISSVFSCVFTEERIEFGHTAIKPRSVECCSDVCPSVDFSYLHIWSWSSTRVTIRVLFTSLDKALLHQLLSLASSRKSPCCFKLLPLRVTETTCFCDPSMLQKFFCTLPQICASVQYNLRGLQTIP